MTLVEALRSHTETCEEIYQTMLELNGQLKSAAGAPDDALLDRQRAALARLEASLERVRTFDGAPELKAPPASSAIEKAQRTIMKALLLDRENEQLLLKKSLGGPRAPVAIKPSSGHLARLYQRHS